jgi:hypothetical protein
MRNASGIGRLGGLAIGLGIGAALAATPGVASADPVSPLDANVAAASVDGVTGTLGTAAADPAAPLDPDIAISFSGITLLQEGTATATSGTGDLAIAIGAGSEADATGGILDSAFADGTSTEAAAGGGILDSAFADGADSQAIAAFGNGDLAFLVNTGSIYDVAEAGGKSPTVLGSFDIASVVGTDSSATAGASATTPGDFDLAGAFGDVLDAGNATGVSDMIDILPSL